MHKNKENWNAIEKLLLLQWQSKKLVDSCAMTCA